MSTSITSNQVALIPLQVEDQRPPAFTREFSSTCGKIRIAAAIAIGLSGLSFLVYTGQYGNEEPFANPSDETRFYANSNAYMSLMSAASLLTPLCPYTECGKVLRVTTRIVGTLITGLAATEKPGVNNFGLFGLIGPLVAFSPEVARMLCWEPCHRNQIPNDA